MKRKYIGQRFLVIIIRTISLPTPISQNKRKKNKYISRTKDILERYKDLF